MSEELPRYGSYTIDAQQNLIAVVRALACEPLCGVAVKTLAERLELSRDAVYRTLKNLELGGWARQFPTGAWGLDVTLTQISEHYRQALAVAHRTYLAGATSHDQ